MESINNNSDITNINITHQINSYEPFNSFEYLFLLIHNVLDLFGNLFLVGPFSALNFYLILKTSVLHPNLKFILLSQSFFIFLRTIFRSYVLIIRLIFNEMIYSPTIIVFIYSAVMYFRNFLCHTIIMERLLATIWVSNYENNRSRWFTYTWVIIDTIITVITAYFFSSSTDVNNLLVNVISQTIMSTLGIIEIFIFLRLLRHNEKVYFERNGSALSIHKLTGRYQLSENIRTTKQLIPTLYLHVCINIIAGLPLGLAYFKIVTSQFGVVLCVSFIVYLPITYLCFFIELSMILCHPFLRRDLRKIFKNFKCLINYGQKSNKIAAEEEQKYKNDQPTLLLKDIRGGQLIKSAGKLEADRHFKSIQDAWETKLPQKKI